MIQNAYIEDLGSLDGTLLNEVLVKGRQRIKTGDAIKVGDTEFLFYKLEGR